jgi:hypothetical protein
MAEHAVAEYHHGDMDIHAQRATFHAVMAATKWSCLAVAVGVLFFTLLFCTDAGFLSAAFSALVLTAVGVVFLARGGSGH